MKKNNQIRYNFRPNLVEHSQILVLVRQFYNSSDKDHMYVLRKLCVFTHALIEGSNRQLLLRFTKGYTRESLEWGRIQMHRRPLGLIGVACLSSDRTQQAKDYDRITHRFSNFVSQYEAYYFDSRCIIVGPENPEIKIDRNDFIYLVASDNEINDGFVNSITDFVSSLYVILESKRIEKQNENFDRMSLPTSPCDQDQGSTDLDNRAMKRKCLGRNKKLLADLCLLSGQYQEALMHYSHATDHLRNVNDYLWIGSALEGCCAASNAMATGNEGMRAKPNTKVKYIGLLIKKSEIQANTSTENVDEEKLRSFGVLNSNDMISKYSECLSYYKKYNTGPLELESHLKFIRILLSMKKKFEVCQVIQCLHVLPIDFNELEKIDLACVLSVIYQQISMYRKSAFFKRRASNYYIRYSEDNSSLAKALSLLQDVCPTYKLKMEQPTATEKKKDVVPTGWGAVQLKVLVEMLEISRKLGNKLDSVRLLVFILEKYGGQLNDTEHQVLVDLLEEYSDDTQPLLNEENKDTNIQLIRPLPIIRDVHAKRLAHYLQPLKHKNDSAEGPFIYSSLSTRFKKTEEEIVWVCGDVSEVAMMVDNPLPAEIKVNNMTLLTEGVEFEAHPATLALPSDSGSFPFMLLGTPVKPGKLTIKGYKVEVLGIANTVLLPTPINIDVTPVLPILQLSSTLPPAPNSSSLNPEDQHYQTLFTSANVYSGHSCTGQVKIENAGTVAVTKLEIKHKKPNEINVIFNNEFVQSKLPLAPGESIPLDVCIMPEQSWKMYTNQDKIETMLTMCYSCEEGDIAGYTREISWITIVKVMPSLEFSNLELYEIERQPHYCLLCFDVENVTSVSMDAECEVKIKDEQIDTSSFSGSLENIPVTFESKKKTSVEVKFPRISLPPPKNKRLTIENQYEKLIGQSVWFSWRLSDTNYNGVTYFQNMKVTTEMVPVLKPKHLNISIQVNKNKISEGEIVDIEKQLLVSITVVLTNSHDMDLEDMTLHVNPYQKCNRSPDRMKQLCLPSGIMNKGIKKLSPGETFQHSCGLLFLYDGDYMIDISCSANRKFGSPTQKRERAFAIAENPPVEKSTTGDSWTTPLSPNSVSRKLKYHEADFWAQSFGISVS